jgi:translation initiation factor IF-2
LGKVRVFSLAKQLGLRSEALIAALGELGVQNVTSATAIDEGTAAAATELLAEQARQARQAAEAEKAAATTTVAVAEPEAPPSEAPAVEEEAEPAAAPVAPAEGVAAEAKPEERIDTKEDRETERYFRRRGPSRLDEEDGLAELERQLAELAKQEEAERARRARVGEVVPLPEVVRRPTGPRPDAAVEVPPVVTVLGHVDHGKTSLLDAIRNTAVAAGESGGITQHIGASEVAVGAKRVVFIDTPGHEAFTAMRARGAMVTDVAVLVVAANDGIMPQTVEAINHAKAAKVPIIVAINKMDLADANPDRVKQQLLEHELVPEEWGGETICVPVSAHTREGIDNLLEMILIVAEVQDLWADPGADFAGIVIESSIDASQGALCTILVRNGTVKTGDSVVCGTAHGRIRRLRDWQGRSVKEMGPGSPVEVVGLTNVPEPGEVMTRVKTPKEARQIAEQRAEVLRQAEFSGHAGGVTLRGLYDEASTGQASLNLIIKGDVWGSVQALEAKFLQLDRRLEELDINVIATGVGDVSESDIMLAKASDAIVIAFHCHADASVRQAAASEGVEIRSYDIIYQALEDIEAALLGLLQPVFEEVLLGRAEVLQLFRVSRIGVIAGCRITDGRLERGAEIRVFRGNEEVWRGPLQSLRHFEQDVRSIDAPNECGIANTNFRAWQIGDRIEAWTRVQVERTLPLKQAE